MKKLPNEVTVSLEHFTESGFGQTLCGVFCCRREWRSFWICSYYIRYSTWKGQQCI
jgi:hypothetical protein